MIVPQELGKPLDGLNMSIEGKREVDQEMGGLSKCPVCGNELTQDTKFCPGCGAYMKYFEENLHEK